MALCAIILLYTTARRYYGVAFGLTNAWVWMKSNATVLNKVQTIVERVVG